MVALPDTCKVAALVGVHQPMEIMEVPIPKEMEYGSIIVKTASATICGSDVHYWEGESTTAPKEFPRILGHEMTGHIARMGPGVTHDSVGQPLSEGDRIIWTHGFCGQCHYCTVENQYTLCTNRRGYMSPLCTEYPYLVGGFAEYCYVYPTSGRLKVPDSVSDDLASAAACALRTVVHGFDRLGRIENRHTVAIQGSGPLGLFSLTQALTAGARKVIVIGGPPGRLEIARKWGADYTLDVGELNAQERHERIMDITGWTRARRGGRGVGCQDRLHRGVANGPGNGPLPDNRANRPSRGHLQARGHRSQAHAHRFHPVGQRGPLLEGAPVPPGQC